MLPTLAIFSWPIVTLILFASLGPARGLIWSVVLGYMFLPENFGYDIPGLPPYDKLTAIPFSLLLASVIHWKKVERLPAQDPWFRVFIIICFVVLIFGSFGTLMQNKETLFNGPVLRQALSLRDVVSMVSDSILIMLPFILAWHFLRKPEDHRHLLVAVVIMGLFYTLLVLFELRMSPQLNKWIYGYFPHNWRQHLRGGGYRPLVFLRHGLWLGFLLFMIIIAAMALYRDKSKGEDASQKASPVLFLLGGIWCFLVLSISRNLGATMLAVMLVPFVLFFGFRTQTRVASVMAVIILTYPFLSMASLTPATKLLEIIAPIAPERAQSFQFRLDNEHLLTERAMEKPSFGWGGYSRQRVFDERGRDLTVTDGLWIITLGQGGWVKYLAFFGFLTAPLLFLRRAARRKEISAPIAGMAVIMGGNFVYMIPNSTLSPLGLIMLGAMAAFVQYDVVREKAPQPVDPTPNRAHGRYSRFSPGQSASVSEDRPLSRFTRPALRQGDKT
jgi:hypothetical protein